MGINMKRNTQADLIQSSEETDYTTRYYNSQTHKFSKSEKEIPLLQETRTVCQITKDTFYSCK